MINYYSISCYHSLSSSRYHLFGVCQGVLSKYDVVMQMWMNVLLTLITVTLMQTAPILLGASPVPVTRDTVGME